MKKLLSLLFAVAMAGLAHAQTADEVISKYLTAIGGEAAWEKVQSLKAKGSIHAQGTEITMSILTAQGKGFRTDYSVMGMSGYSIITPTAGWYFNPGGGQTKAEPMKEDQVKLAQSQLDVQGPLVNYKAKGTKVEYLGTEKIEGAPYYKLKVVPKDGPEESWYIDPSNNYLLRRSSKFMVDGKEQEQITTFSSYQKLPQGIVFPMTVGTANGEINFSSVEVNQPVDEKAFVPAG